MKSTLARAPLAVAALAVTASAHGSVAELATRPRFSRGMGAPHVTPSRGRSDLPVPLTRQCLRDLACRALRARVRASHGGRTAARDTVRAAFASMGNRADLLACKGVAHPEVSVRQWANGVNLLAYVAKTDTVRGTEVVGPNGRVVTASGTAPVIPQSA